MVAKLPLYKSISLADRWLLFQCSVCGPTLYITKNSDAFLPSNTRGSATIPVYMIKLQKAL